MKVSAHLYNAIKVKIFFSLQSSPQGQVRILNMWMFPPWTHEISA